MKLSPIFVNENNEGLHAIHYEGEELNEFDKLLDAWNDTEYVSNYCFANQEYLNTDFFENITIDKLIDKILHEAIELENVFLNWADNRFADNKEKLQTIFRPLINQEHNQPSYQKSKAKVIDRQFKNPILRLYAIRIAPNTFVITGGAIKITHLMSEHIDTIVEKDKLSSVIQFLKNNEITTEDDLNYYYGQF